MPKTPEEITKTINNATERLTSSELVQLAETLDKVCEGSGKDFVKLLKCCIADRDSKRQQVKNLLMSALDWLQYGN